jgi:hypothetical protein
MSSLRLAWYLQTVGQNLGSHDKYVITYILVSKQAVTTRKLWAIRHNRSYELGFQTTMLQLMCSISPCIMRDFPTSFLILKLN